MSLMTARKLSGFAAGLIAVSVLQGCAGVKASYKSLIEVKDNVPAIYLSVGETKEVLSISNGFPGWWGRYPEVTSFSPEVASVECREERSWIPFRSPGLIVGGEVCYLTANTVGETWLREGNKFSMNQADDLKETDGATKVIIGQ